MTRLMVTAVLSTVRYSHIKSIGRFWFTFAVALATGWASPGWATLFTTTNLVTDDQGANAAQITDPGLKNAWGVSYSPGSPFWVSSNGAGTATLYQVNPVTNATTKLGLTVAIPGDGSVTGQAFASVAGNFNNDTFLFVSEDGTVSGWRGALGTTAETLVVASANNVYKGSALATVGSSSYLYMANFRQGRIDVLNGSAAAPGLTGTFTDPSLPSGYAPFDIAFLGGKLYVTYALQDAARRDEISGAGFGFVNVFDLQGNFLARIGTMGTLNAPWGLAFAPASFGQFAGDLLVGNFGDGTINAFDAITDTFQGQLRGTNGNPLVIDGLWALIAGNGANAGSSQSIYFSAGPNDETNGLFGVITGPAPIGVPEPATLALLCAGLAGLGFSRRAANSVSRRRGAV